MIKKIGFTILILSSLAGCTQKSSDPKDATTVAAPADKLVELQKNAETSPSYENYISLGLEYANTNRFSEAVETYEKAIKINPKAPIAYNNICAAFNAQARYADAVESCEKAVALEPNFELATNNLKLAKEKFAAFRTEILAKKPEMIKSVKTSADNLNVGMQLFLARDLEAANQMWTRIPPSDPFYPAALNNIASAQILTGQYDGAEKTLAKALTLQPDNQLFLNNKRWLETKKLAR